MGSTSTMKADQDFREQVGQVTNWFSNWSECEQSVALYSLLKRLKPVQAKFLVQVLQQSLSDCTQVKANEEKANDPAFLSQLVSEHQDTAVVHLLRYLPLLQSGNEAAKAVFLQVIPKVLSRCLERAVSIEESRQLLSYSLIHPAFSAEERNELSHWLNTLEEKLTHQFSHPSLGNSLAEAPPSSASSSSQTPTSTNSSSLSSLSSSSSPSLSCTCNGVMQNGVNQNGGGMNAVGGMNGWQGSFPLEVSGPPPVVSGAHGSELLDVAAGSGSVASMRMKSLAYNHMPVRLSNSHIGAISSLPNHHTPLHATSSAPPNFGALALPDSQAGIGGQTGNRHTPLRRTASVVPNPLETGAASSSSSGKVEHWLHSHNSSSDPHLHPFTTLRPSPSTLSQGQSHPPGLGDHSHAPLSPQSSITSSGSGGSDCHHDDGPQPVRDSFMEEGSGMRDVPVWLKQLRLHKYSYLLKQMTYEEMMGISVEWLAARNVTTGARNKIVLSIQKLHERQKLLCQLEKDIMEGAPVKNALSEIKNMLITPIKAFTPTDPASLSDDPNKVAEGDLPSQLVRLMGKVCTQLLVSRHDDEDFALYLQLIDKCTNHEAFTAKQRLLLSSWRQEAQKNWNPSNHKFLDKPRKSSWGAFPLKMSSSLRFGGQAVRGAGAKPMQWSFGVKRTNLGPTASCHLPIQRNNSLNTAFLNRPGLLEAKQTVTRTHSAPIQSDQLHLSMPGDQPFAGSNLPTSDMEINASLDSLCLQMTEQALGCDSPDRGSTF